MTAIKHFILSPPFTIIHVYEKQSTDQKYLDILVMEKMISFLLLKFNAYRRSALCIGEQALYELNIEELTPMVPVNTKMGVTGLCYICWFSFQPCNKYAKKYD